MAQKKKMYNHLFSLAFSVDTEKENWQDVTIEELWQEFQRRIDDVRKGGIDCFCYESDTYEYEVEK